MAWVWTRGWQDAGDFGHVVDAMKFFGDFGHDDDAKFCRTSAETSNLDSSEMADIFEMAEFFERLPKRLLLDRSFVSGPVGGMIGPVGGQMLAILDNLSTRKFVEFRRCDEIRRDVRFGIVRNGGHL